MDTNITQTSLISVAAILIGIGGATIPTNVLVGGIELGAAVLILIIRGVLGQYGIVTARPKK